MRGLFEVTRSVSEGTGCDRLRPSLTLRVTDLHLPAKSTSRNVRKAQATKAAADLACTSRLVWFWAEGGIEFCGIAFHQHLRGRNVRLRLGVQDLVDDRRQAGYSGNWRRDSAP